MVRVKNGIVIYENQRLASAPVNLVALAQACGYKVNQMAENLNISPRQLERQFLSSLGVSPKYWMRLQRMILARQLIRTGTPLKATALELGFVKYDKFAQEMKRFYQITPMEMVGRERQKCYDHESFNHPPSSEQRDSVASETPLRDPKPAPIPADPPK